MKKITLPILSVMMGFVIVGCDDDDNDNINYVTPAEDYTYLRVIHGSSNAPKVNVNAAGETIAGLSAVDFEQGSNFLTLPQGMYPVSVDAILADMTTVEVLNLGDVNLMPDTEYTVFAHGYVGDADTPLATAVLANPVTDVGDGNIRVQVLHAAPNAPTVDLHVTGAMDDLSVPLATLGYGDNTGQVEVPAGIYRVRLTLAGDNSTVAYDITLPDLPAGADLFVAAVPNVGIMTSPVTLLVNDGSNMVNEGTTFKLIDDRTQSSVRVVHGAADVPNVDIFVNDTKVDALSNAPFTGVTGYVDVPEGSYTVDTKLTADNSITGITGELMVMKDVKYTVHAVGTLDATDSAALEYLPLIDDTRAVATESKVRISHAHPSVGNVDIYITADGMIDDAEPVWSGVGYKASTGYVAVMPGEYNVKVTLSGTKTVAIDTGILDLMGGKIYTALAVDNTAGSPANLVLMDDFISM